MTARKKPLQPSGMCPQVTFYCCSNCSYQTTHDANARRHIHRTCTAAQIVRKQETMLAWTSNDQIVRAVEAGHPGTWGRVDRLDGLDGLDVARATAGMPTRAALDGLPLNAQAHEIFKRLNC